MSIDSPSSLAQVLEKHGYAPKVTGDSLFIPIGGTSAPYTAAFTFRTAGLMQITCQLALLGDFPEAGLTHLGIAALDANTQISPYAFAIIGAAEGDADPRHSPLVLIDTLPTLGPSRGRGDLRRR